MCIHRKGPYEISSDPIIPIFLFDIAVQLGAHEYMHEPYMKVIDSFSGVIFFI